MPVLSLPERAEATEPEILLESRETEESLLNSSKLFTLAFRFSEESVTGWSVRWDATLHEIFFELAVPAYDMEIAVITCKGGKPVSIRKFA